MRIAGINKALSMSSNFLLDRMTARPAMLNLNKAIANEISPADFGRISRAIVSNHKIQENERSLYLKLENPLPGGITHLQVKGVLFDSRQEIMPHMGIGRICGFDYFNEQGVIVYNDSEIVRPQGGIFLDNAVREFTMSDKFYPLSQKVNDIRFKLPVGWGWFTNVRYGNAILGFVILGMDDIAASFRGYPYSADGFKLIGKSLAFIHKHGSLYGRNMHEFNITLKDDVIYLHDLENTLDFVSDKLSPKQFLAGMFLDLNYMIEKISPFWESDESFGYEYDETLDLLRGYLFGGDKSTPYWFNPGLLKDILQIEARAANEPVAGIQHPLIGHLKGMAHNTASSPVNALKEWDIVFNDKKLGEIVESGYAWKTRGGWRIRLYIVSGNDCIAKGTAKITREGVSLYSCNDLHTKVYGIDLVRRVFVRSSEIAGSLGFTPSLAFVYAVSQDLNSFYDVRDLDGVLKHLGFSEDHKFTQVEKQYRNILVKRGQDSCNYVRGYIYWSMPLEILVINSIQRLKERNSYISISSSPMANRIQKVINTLELQILVKRLRQERFWSKNKLAKVAGLGGNMVINGIENGYEKRIKLATLEKLALAFGMPTEELLQKAKINFTASSPVKKRYLGHDIDRTTRKSCEDKMRALEIRFGRKFMLQEKQDISFSARTARTEQPYLIKEELDIRRKELNSRTAEDIIVLPVLYVEFGRKIQAMLIIDGNHRSRILLENIPAGEICNTNGYKIIPKDGKGPVIIETPLLKVAELEVISDPRTSSSPVNYAYASDSLKVLNDSMKKAFEPSTSDLVILGSMFAIFIAGIAAYLLWNNYYDSKNKKRSSLPKKNHSTGRKNNRSSSPIDNSDKNVVVRDSLKNAFGLIQAGRIDTIARALDVLNKVSPDIKLFQLRAEYFFLMGLAWYSMALNTDSFSDYNVSLQYFEVLEDQIRKEKGFDWLKKNTYLHLGWINIWMGYDSTAISWFKKAIAEYGDEYNLSVEASLSIIAAVKNNISFSEDKIKAALIAGSSYLNSGYPDLIKRAYHYLNMAYYSRDDISESYFYLGQLWKIVAESANPHQIVAELQEVDSSYIPEEKRELLVWAREFVNKAKTVYLENSVLYVHKDPQVYMSDVNQFLLSLPIFAGRIG
ncbi:XRE family transcriptional regulator [bacterium]|nr:MAG: XRE family transcriptional regulator [bacterium]